ncbi:LuxR C-terminal-related transcriptional regulator [Aequorivita sp. SDUM287046]|uniref:LuxR C-terminal-related transcriptional regulator n=1 Tax=Aequorivita aurantiaca TaxID=3053356 RepID=A0ABT8DDQ0_9FLAO|nr:LuxR C-terminal-related transcriptional regulator [Aequorivita aurantiaca]MDN3722772.1 LuxR C-terminal-related transcriptional regulator [Aequorivita aurantiaca]
MDKVNKLLDIWDRIPQAVNEQLDLSQKDIINNYMDVFHFGEYFYVIFNTRTTEMEYVNPNVEKLLGYTQDEFQLQIVLDNLHPDDLPYYYHYEQSAVRFFSGLLPELFFKYKFAYDYRLKIKDNSYKRIQQQIVPLYYFPEGGARTLGIFTDLTHLNIQGIPKLSFIGMKGAPSYYNVHLKEEFHLSSNIFTKKEVEILNYIAKGLTSEHIAKHLNRSIFTVRNHRKNLLHKSGCASVPELLVKSIREGWV